MNFVLVKLEGNKLKKFYIKSHLRNDMYHAGEFLGFLNEQRKLHPAAIPKEDIENPEQYQAVYDRLAELSDFSGSFKPTADFSLFEVDYKL